MPTTSETFPCLEMESIVEAYPRSLEGDLAENVGVEGAIHLAVEGGRRLGEQT